MLNIGVFIQFLYLFDNFQHFLNFFQPIFFGIFELLWQCSQFQLKWINSIFSKLLSYSHFKNPFCPVHRVKFIYSSYKLCKLIFVKWLKRSHFEKITQSIIADAPVNISYHLSAICYELSAFLYLFCNEQTDILICRDSPYYVRGV